MTFAWEGKRLLGVLPYQDLAVSWDGEEVVLVLQGMNRLVIVPNDFSYWFSMEILISCRSTNLLFMFVSVQIPDVNLPIDGSSSQNKWILWMKLNEGAAVVSFNGLIGFRRVQVFRKDSPSRDDTFMFAPSNMICLSVSHCQNGAIARPRNTCDCKLIILLLFFSSTFRGLLRSWWFLIFIEVVIKSSIIELCVLRVLHFCINSLLMLICVSKVIVIAQLI